MDDADLTPSPSDAPEPASTPLDDAPVPAPPPPPAPAGIPLEAGTVLSLREDPEGSLHRAFAELRAGGVVVLPTDTVYGIAANAFDRQATARIFTIKRRPRSLPLPVLVSRPRQAWALCSDVPAYAAELAAAFWPGGLTLVLPMVDGLEWDLGDDPTGTVALRIPAHADLVRLLERIGPIACTSANVSGEPTPPTIEGIRDRLGSEVGVYLDGGPARSDQGSTIVDCTGREPRIIREGTISALQIRAAANRAQRP